MDPEKYRVLVILRKISAFVITATIVSLLSAYVVTMYNKLYIDIIDRQYFWDNFPWVLFCVILTGVSYLVIAEVFFKVRPLNLFKAGLLCILIEPALVFLLTFWVWLDLKSLLYHLLTIGTFCILIPYLYHKLNQMLPSPSIGPDF
jgi:hypothetical protein